MSNARSADSGTLTIPTAVPDRRPFGGKRRLYNVVRLRFKASFVGHWYDARALELADGDRVIAETSRGPALAFIVGECQRKVVPVGSLKRVLRRASDEDLDTDRANAKDERDAFRLALRYIRSRNLAMKLVQVHYMHDRSKAIFYFSAEGRIDFRGLVKDLASDLRMRIEMRQIGARDGARMIGGIGPCGRELCCSTFLENFSPVSIRMAKDQGLTLNPKKVSGMCGRLMCCLVYEQQVYASARRRLPRHGKPVATPQGLGTIKSVDVLQETVAVYLDEGKLEKFKVSEVVVLSPKQVEKRRELAESEQRARRGRKRSGGEDEYLWADEGKSDGGRRRRRRGGSRGDGAKKGEGGRGGRGSRSDGDRGRSRQNASSADRKPAPKDAAASPSPQAADGERKPKRRRRRRGKPPAGSQGERKAGSGNERRGGDGAKKAPGADAAPKGKAGADGGDAPQRKRRRRRRRRKPGDGGGGGGGGEKS